MPCCSERAEGGHDEGCCTRRKGCCTPGSWSLILLISGTFLIALAIATMTVLTTIINEKIDDGICDQVCIPEPTAEQWKINNWATNYNRSRNPEEYFKFYLYNMTNADAFLAGSLPNFTIIGPYVYQVDRAKYNITWHNNNAEVSYQTFEQYHFRPDLSTGEDSDWFVNINLPFMGGSDLVNPLGLSSFLGLQCGTSPSTDWHNGSPDQACLVQKRSVRDTLFQQNNSYVINFGNTVVFGAEEVLNPNFQIFFNCSSHEDCHEKYALRQNYGMGGACQPVSIPNAPDASEVLPCMYNSSLDFSWKQYTGQGNLNDLATLTQYLGNTSLSLVWNTTLTYNTTIGNQTESHTIVTPEKVQGTDHFQFRPHLEDHERLTIWDDLLYRHVDLTYLKDTSYLGVDMVRYVPDSSLFMNRDPFFWGSSNATTGLLDLEWMPQVRYGAPTPLYASEPYFYKADPSVRKMYNCSNCPSEDELNSKSIDEMGSFVDVEPNTGKVLRGQKRGQINVYLESTLLPTLAQVPQMYFPVFWFENGATMDSQQADLVKDGVSKINLAHTARLALIAGGFSLGAVFVLVGVYLRVRFNKLKDTPPRTAYGDYAPMNH